MWYFTWILGLLLACSLGIINVLRLEAQETWDKEQMPLDPLTHLITKETMLRRLKEKVENSKRNKLPFSIIFISLKSFKTINDLHEYEIDAILRSVVDCFKEDIRSGVDIAARIDDYDFLIAMPGFTLKRAEEIAALVKVEILTNVKLPRKLVFEVLTGIAEYTDNLEKLSSTALEVDKLINSAKEKAY